MTVLARGLQHAGSQLSSLDLSGNCVAYETVSASLTSPRQYHLHGLTRLADLVANYLPLQHLDLTGNSLGADGGALLHGSRLRGAALRAATRHCAVPQRFAAHRCATRGTPAA